jgi:hypothetical protein
MTDLVQRLRDVDEEFGFTLCAVAADRIEQLEAEVLEQARLLGIGGEKELALTAKLEAAEKDAARYRWMRDQGGFTLDRLIDECETILHVDAAVDAAMKEQT